MINVLLILIPHFLKFFFKTEALTNELEQERQVRFSLQQKLKGMPPFPVNLIDIVKYVENVVYPFQIEKKSFLRKISH